MSAARAALALARRRPGPGALGPRGGTFARAFALGDLQASAERIFDVLAHHDLLAPSGELAADVQLLAIGDYFDFGTRASGHIEAARRDGRDVLAYLAAHSPEQVVLLAGNHDLSRVMELAHASFDRFEAAAPLAAELVALRDSEPAAFRQRIAELCDAYPELPGPGLVHRDYSAFTEEQRALVQQLLMSGRLRLAATARLPSGEPVLATHAGVTMREVAMLEVSEVAPAPIAAALEKCLARALTEVTAAWAAGEAAALSLAPLHVRAATGKDGLGELPEGGGMLYHRPADPERKGADRSWEAAPGRPRRFDPRALPAGVAQIAGHTGHPKCVEELSRWSPSDMHDRPCGKRSLRVRGEDVRYELGAARPEDGEAVLYLIDPSLHRAPSAASVELLELMPGSVA